MKRLVTFLYFVVTILASYPSYGGGVDGPKETPKSHIGSCMDGLTTIHYLQFSRLELAKLAPDPDGTYSGFVFISMHREGLKPWTAWYPVRRLPTIEAVEANLKSLKADGWSGGADFYSGALVQAPDGSFQAAEQLMGHLANFRLNVSNSIENSSRQVTGRFDIRAGEKAEVTGFIRVRGRLVP